MTSRDLDPVRVPTRVLADLQQNPLGYAIAGAGYMGVIFGTIVGIFAVIAVLVLPGLIAEDETLALTGGVLAGLFYVVTLPTLVLAVVPLMNASLLRALEAQRLGDQPLGLGALFSTFRQDAMPIIVFSFVSQMLTLIGMLFCYVPGFIVLAATLLGLPLIVFEGARPIEALQRGFGHLRDHALWHLVVWLVLWVCMSAAQFTIIGVIFVYPVMMAFQLYAYREAFHDDEA